MIKVSRFFREVELECQKKHGLNEAKMSFWERVRYFTNIDEAYKYYSYCLTYGGANCAFTISDGTIEHTVLSHYTDDFPECMKKKNVLCDVAEIIYTVYTEEE